MLLEYFRNYIAYDSILKVTKNMNHPKRPCYYCGLLQSQIATHLKSKYKDEDVTQSALSNSKKRDMN